jgi:hypothetical protein
MCVNENGREIGSSGRVNRRIRKKKLDTVDRLLATGLRLYATRPQPPGEAALYDEFAIAFLGISVGFALRERLQSLPGPRRGCEMDPPRGLKVEMADENTIHIVGLVMIRDRRGEKELSVEKFRLTAERKSQAWRMTRVLMTPTERQQWEAAAC